MRFGVIISDPPWRYDNSPDRAHGGASSVYVTQTDDWLSRLPVAPVCDDNCMLLLWATGPKLPEAVDLARAWGFKHKTAFPWLKMRQAAAPRVGIGFHQKACTEFLLFATRGRVVPPRGEDRVQGVIFNPIGEHSRKPQAQYAIAELYPGPYLEMFHRPRDGALFGPRPGWWFAGNECPGSLDMADALAELASLPQPPPAAAVTGATGPFTAQQGFFDIPED